MNYEQEEYLEQDEDEREAAGRRMALVALLILAVLVMGGIVLADRLRDVSRLQDCLLTRANCAPITPPASPSADGSSTSR